MLFPVIHVASPAKSPAQTDPQIQNIISLFPSTRQFIDEALGCGGAVLVHCNSECRPSWSGDMQIGNSHPGGIATAPAIVMGYLMDKFRWDYSTALMYVQSKRYCVSPNSVSCEYTPELTGV